jgi:hypothetical protein
MTSWVGVLGVVAGLSLASQPSQSRGAPSVSIQDIVNAWKLREEGVHSLAFEYQQSLFIPKGERSFSVVVGGTPVTFRQVRCPPQDVTWEYTCGLKIDGKNVRYEYRGPRAIEHLGEYVQSGYLTVTDGRVCTTFFDKAADGRSHPTGYIDDPRRELLSGAVYRQLYLRPILLCYRPYAMPNPDDFDLSQFLANPEPVVLRQHNCVVLSGVSGDYRTLFWVDVEKESVPVRWQSIVQGALRIQVDMEYSRDALRGWAPSDWTFSVYAQPEAGQRIGKLKEQGSARVTKYELNTEVAPSEFRFEFPLGTYVVDNRKDECYILRENGTKRLVTQREVNAGYSYEELVATETGRAGGVVESRPRRWPLPVLSAALVLCVVVFVLRRQIRKRGQ